MHESKGVRTWFRRLGGGSVVLLEILLLEGCPPPGPAQPPSTVAGLQVNICFGAYASPPYACTGGGTVTITSPSGGSQQKNYSYSGTSSIIPNTPACCTSEVFGNLRPGTWTVAAPPATCQVSVVAGQDAVVNVTDGLCR
jgi:hypothetical protein